MIEKIRPGDVFRLNDGSIIYLMRLANHGRNNETYVYIFGINSLMTLNSIDYRNYGQTILWLDERNAKKIGNIRQNPITSIMKNSKNRAEEIKEWGFRV